MLRLTPHNPEKVLPLIANAIMVSILFFLLFQLGLKFYASPKPSEEIQATGDTNGTKTPQRQNKNRGKEIASMHLFGLALQKEALATKQKIDAPATKLNLTLRGIIAETEREQGHAIIQDNESSEEQFFKVDDLVFGLATLKEIYPDRVILLHNKKYETLFLPKEALSKKNISYYASIAAERKQAATDFRKAFLRGDGEELNTLFGFDTAYKSGSFVGFTVKSLGEKGQQMMEIFGVEDGDLITVIDGMRLSESLEAFQKIKTLKSATSVDIIIDRNGNEIPFHFELDTPADLASTSTDQPSINATTNSTLNSTTTENTPDQQINTEAAGQPNSIIAEDDADDADLGEDWGESEEAQDFAAQQRAKTTGVRNEVVFDH